MGTLDTIVDAVLHYAAGVLAATALELFVLLAPGLVLAFMMNLLAGVVENRACALMGFRRYYAWFGWLGTVVHEGNHALMCLLFGHRITEIKWFDPDAQGGSLGHVKHSFDRNSLYQNMGRFFIGVAPLLLGTLVTYYSARYLLGTGIFDRMSGVALDSRSLTSLRALSSFAGELREGTAHVLAAVFTRAHLLDWRFYIFLYIAFCVGSSIRLSPSDLEGAAAGFGTLVGALLVVNALTLWAGNFVVHALEAFARTYTVFYTVMIFAFLLNAIAAIVLLSLPAGKLGVTATARAARRIGSGR